MKAITKETCNFELILYLWHLIDTEEIQVHFFLENP